MGNLTDEQIANWNTRGQVWVEHQPLLDRCLGVVGDAAMDHANVKAGESVIDVGCGSGGSTLQLAERRTT